ncbi:hypothetical protein ACFQ08_10805 [Streptosporangium algeriense]|uniref:Major facilitator superfamily (MFS) profile domain-containing protein n=1 Tax=Streptosporangium algeriense TaxID=1682748 RepID=A0ABW3DQS5_9ACTN
MIGLGHGLVTPSIMASAYRTLPRAAVPEAATASQIVIRVGTALGAAVTAVILQALTRSYGTAAFAGGFAWTLVIIAVALVPALMIPRHRPPAP